MKDFLYYKESYKRVNIFMRELIFKSQNKNRIISSFHCSSYNLIISIFIFVSTLILQRFLNECNNKMLHMYKTITI